MSCTVKRSTVQEYSREEYSTGVQWRLQYSRGWWWSGGSSLTVRWVKSPHLAVLERLLPWPVLLPGDEDPPDKYLVLLVRPTWLLSLPPWTSECSLHCLVSSTVGFSVLMLYNNFCIYFFLLNQHFYLPLQSNFSNNVKVFFLSNQSLKIKINLSSFSVLGKSKQI